MWTRIKQYFKEYFEYRRTRRMLVKELEALAQVAVPVVTEVAGETEKVVSAVGKATDVILRSTPESLVGDVIQSAAEVLNTTQPQLMQTITYIFSLTTDEVQSLVINATLARNMEDINKIREGKESDVSDIQELV